MGTLELNQKSRAQATIESLSGDLVRRLEACPTALCPLESISAFVKLCSSQSCGKCTPCRIGLSVLADMLDNMLDGKAKLSDIEALKATAKVIYDSADCAIGFEAAKTVLRGLDSFKDDFISHIEQGHCSLTAAGIPCVSGCPAGVDIPGYIALVAAGKYDEAVSLIRRDNPFPVVCGYICEHPCEKHCRRTIVDAPINIRGLKNFATINSNNILNPVAYEKTGKRVAVIGGGPSGLTAAYFLSLMGHEVTIFEQRDQLGGMLRYGIPSYRLDRNLLDRDINNILSLGVRIEKTSITSGEQLQQIKDSFDALYIAIGAHTDKKLGIENENAEGVISAVDMLRQIGDGNKPDFTGKDVVIVGGGNVAMDCTRSAKRLNAKSVTCVYRRRIVDMTALPDEVRGAEAEGCLIKQLVAPVRIKALDGVVKALIGQPQIIGAVDRNNRPAPSPADTGEIEIKADIIIVAIGQAIESKPFEELGIGVKRGCILTDNNGAIQNFDGVFAGGDCVFGPLTVIKAVEAGKVAARSIDNYLGYNHPIKTEVEIPAPRATAPQGGRVNLGERDPLKRSEDFEKMEIPMTKQEAEYEASRCLRCEHYGNACFKNGRKNQW